MIDYGNIAEALRFYASAGFRVIEVPWLVPADIDAITRPASCRAYATLHGCLVASGELGFLSLARQGRLPPGRYVCATPCFRDEPVLDDLHQLTFFKVELITIGSPQPVDLEDMMRAALRFHTEVLGLRVGFVPQGKSLYDLMAGEVEMGSYGIRQHEELHWAYGTGCAEPRASLMQRRQVRDWDRV